jgi:DNA-binding MarR family transcriptional regulator
MELETFLPYRLSVVAEAVSRALSAVYADRFDLTRDEWRVLAQLADARELKATELGARTSLPKMAVSRAVTRMERDGLIARTPDADDRRNLVVRLLPPGRALYRKVEPMVLEREAYLREGMGEAEQRALTEALARLEARARELVRKG